MDLLGPLKIADLTTADIRIWHRTLKAEVGNRSANMAKTLLGAALALMSEDFGLRLPRMPTRLGPGRAKTKKIVRGFYSERQNLTPGGTSALGHERRRGPVGRTPAQAPIADTPTF